MALVWVTNVGTERRGMSDEVWETEQRLIAKHTKGPPKPNPRFGYSVEELVGFGLIGLYKEEK